MRGEREMFERACWKIFVLQVHVSTRGVRSFFFFSRKRRTWRREGVLTRLLAVGYPG